MTGPITTRTSTTACVTGCKRRDRHQRDCPCPTTTHEHDPRASVDDGHGVEVTAPVLDDTGEPITYLVRCCRGCLPRGAVHGQVCEACHRNLSDSILGAPHLIAHLRAQVAPTGGGAGNEHVAGTREPPAPLSVPALDAADELHATLVSWAMEAAEQRGLPGPTLTSTRFSDSRIVADRWGAAVQRGRPVGLRRPPLWGASGFRAHDVVEVEVTAPVPDRAGQPIRYVVPRPAARPRPAGPADTDVVAAWLRTHQEWIEHQDWAGEVVTELWDQTRTALARWPMESRTRAMADVPCPKCERLTLTYTPPAFHGSSAVVQCSRTDCAHRIDEAYWPHYAHLLEQAHAEQTRETTRAAS